MDFEIINTLSEDEWSDFVNKNPEGNIFHTPEMFRVFKNAQGYQPELWAARKNGRLLVLFLPVRVNFLKGLLPSLTTRSIVYGSVLGASDDEAPEALTQLLNTYRQEALGKALFTELRNLDDMSIYQGVLQRCGYVREDHLNYIIDLNMKTEILWNNLHRSAKTNIKAAQRRNVEIREVTESDQISVVYSIINRVYRYLRVPLAHQSLFEAAFHVLYPLGMVKFLLAGVGDVNLAMAIRLLYKDKIYAWYAGALRGFSSYKAHDLLNWHIIDWGARNGFSVFDFGGAGKPNQEYGPRDFKAKFGGKLVNYGRYVYIHHPYQYRLSEWVYKWFRRLY